MVNVQSPTVSASPRQDGDFDDLLHCPAHIARMAADVISGELPHTDEGEDCQRAGHENAHDPGGEPCRRQPNGERGDERGSLGSGPRCSRRIGKSFAARIGRPPHEGHHPVTRHRSGRDERGRRLEGAFAQNLLEPRYSDDDREEKCQHTERADARIAHDPELSLPVGRSPESVDRVGKPVFMDGAGDDHDSKDRQCR